MEELSFSFNMSVNDEFSNRNIDKSAVSTETVKGNLFENCHKKVNKRFNLRVTKDENSRLDLVSIKERLTKDSATSSNIEIVSEHESTMRNETVKESIKRRNLMETIKSNIKRNLSQSEQIDVIDERRYSYLKNLIANNAPLGKRKRRDNLLIKPNSDVFDEDSYYTVASEEKDDYNKEYDQGTNACTVERLVKANNVYDSLSESEDSQDEGIPEDSLHILPNSQTEFYFELTMISGSFLSLIILPFYLAFEIEKNFLYSIAVLTDISHLLQFYYWFNKPFTDIDDKLVFTRKHIIKEFAKNRLVRTITSSIPTLPFVLQTFPFDSLGVKSTKYCLIACIIFRFVNLFRDDNLFSTKKIHKTDLQIDKILKFLICCMIFLNFATCVWLFLGFSKDSPDDWIVLKTNTDNSQFDIFIAGFFFCTVTTLTIGYGDITPVNFEEYVFVIIFMFLGVGLFSFLLSSLALLFSKGDGNVKTKERLEILNRFHKDFKLPANLLKKITRYVKKNEIEFHTQKVLFLESLPITIKRIFINKVMTFEFNKLDFFQSDNYEFFLSTVRILRYSLFSKHELIYQFGETIKEINLIHNGRLGLQLGDSFFNIMIGTKETGSTVGDVEFYFDEQIEFQVKCVSKQTNTLTIRGVDFVELEKEFPHFVLNAILTSIKGNESTEIRKKLLFKLIDYKVCKEDLEFVLILLHDKISSQKVQNSVYGEESDKQIENFIEETLEEYEKYYLGKYKVRLVLSKSLKYDMEDKKKKIDERKVLDKNLESQKNMIAGSINHVKAVKNISKQEQIKTLIKKLRTVSNNFVFEQKCNSPSKRVNNIGLEKGSFYSENGIIDGNVLNLTENLIGNEIDAQSIEQRLNTETGNEIERTNSVLVKISMDKGIFSNFERQLD